MNEQEKIKKRQFVPPHIYEKSSVIIFPFIIISILYTNSIKTVAGHEWALATLPPKILPAFCSTKEMPHSFLKRKLVIRSNQVNKIWNLSNGSFFNLDSCLNEQEQ